MRNISKRILTFTLGVLFALLSTVGVYSSASALTFQDASRQSINFYTPYDTTCIPSYGTQQVTPAIKNSDYKNGSILSGAQLTSLDKNRSTYEEAGKQAGIPWQLIAALHVRESGMKLINPSSGGGLYGDDEKIDGPYENGKEVGSEEFLRQSVSAGNRLKSKVGNPTTLSQGNQDQIKTALFNYDGAQQAYKDQASSLGFSSGYDGSPYVMNRADDKRDPTVDKNKTTWGEFDGDTLSYPASSAYGAYIIYAALAGIGPDGSCGNLSEGGMTLEQAASFMEIYKDMDRGDPRGDFDAYIKGRALVCKAKTDNCTAFSAYFTNKYTTLKSVSKNGRDVVNAMASVNQGLPTGKEPRPYAIFSTNKSNALCKGSPCGHTGVVLGVDKERNVITIGEAVWCAPGATRAREYPLNSWTNTSYTYAYTDQFIKPEMKNALRTGTEPL